MRRQKMFITGATGTMGIKSLERLAANTDLHDIVILARGTKQDRDILKPYASMKRVEIHWGDLEDYAVVRECVKEADMVVHIAAFVSPEADYHPEKAMSVNYGGTRNIIKAIYDTGRQVIVRLVYIGTVAETGDRMPPIHWGQVGDPIKPSVFDYYAVSKVAAERLVIESGLKYWVSLRQTGIMGPAMGRIEDPIIFHNPLDNVLEYISDRDLGRLIGNLCAKTVKKELPEEFWCHIYNIGGGESCRVDTYTMFVEILKRLGITRVDYAMEPSWFALKNFHGQYYLDSDKLEEYLHFRKDGMEYFYDSFIENLGKKARIAQAVSKMLGGQRLIGAVAKSQFRRIASGEHGTIHFVKEDMKEKLAVYWGGRETWEAIPREMKAWKMRPDWKEVRLLNHGYDETKPEEELSIQDMRGAAKYRGGQLISKEMTTGDWTGKLEFVCGFGHHFTASPRLILEGGHWCPECERKSWNYGERAKQDPFFAQVWYPLHDEGEVGEYPKRVTELDVE